MAAGIAIPSLAYWGSAAMLVLHDKSAIMTSNTGVCFVWCIFVWCLFGWWIFVWWMVVVVVVVVVFL